jgi:protocatechuate 3,4-dioxygenase beta subunit
LKSKLQALVLLSISLCAAFGSAAPAFAQTHRASLRGTVTDPNGAVVAGAEVRLVNTGTSETRTAESGEEGQYAISSLPPGTYRLEVSKADRKNTRLNSSHK